MGRSFFQRKSEEFQELVKWAGYREMGGLFCNPAGVEGMGLWGRFWEGPLGGTNGNFGGIVETTSGIYALKRH